MFPSFQVGRSGQKRGHGDEMRGKLKALDGATGEVSRIASSIEKVKK